MRLCQHPNKASKIVTFSSYCFCLAGTCDLGITHRCPRTTASSEHRHLRQKALTANTAERLSNCCYLPSALEPKFVSLVLSQTIKSALSLQSFLDSAGSERAPCHLFALRIPKRNSPSAFKLFVLRDLRKTYPRRSSARPQKCRTITGVEALPPACG